MLRSFIAPLAGGLLLIAAGAAQSAILVYSTGMLGSNEVPPNGSPATGFTTLTIDDTLNTLGVDVVFSGLTGGPAAAAHIHCCTAPGTNIGVAIPFTGFPAATSGHYVASFDLLNTSTYTSSFLTNFGGGTASGAEAALLAGLAAGRAYSNIHDATFPGGEIRGFLRAGIPEPSAWALMIVGFGLAGAALRRRQRLASA